MFYRSPQPSESTSIESSSFSSSGRTPTYRRLIIFATIGILLASSAEIRFNFEDYKMM